MDKIYQVVASNMTVVLSIEEKWDKTGLKVEVLLVSVVDLILLINNYFKLK